MEYSKEQEEIFEFAVKGIQNLIVQAVAGAGKTTTLVECATRFNSDKKILILAHNKSTKDTLEERVGSRENIHIYTLHGLGWRMFKEHFDKVPVLDEDKYKNYINQNITEIAAETYGNLKKGQRMVYKSMVFELVSKARQNLKQSEKEIRKMATKKYGYHLISDECATAAKVLQWGCENLDTVDYLDLIWLPSELGYFTKRYLSDIVMLDEAQDASLAQQDILKRCMKRETRLIAFGDSEQTINSWAGSDTEAFNHLKDAKDFRRDAKEMPLSINFRCGSRIIEYAKQYTTHDIKARNGAQLGEVHFDVYTSKAKDGDMILCRNAAPLMEVYKRGISQGQKMYFRGSELGKKLIEEADSTDGDTIQDIIDGIKLKMIATWDNITKGSGLDEKETVGNPIVQSLYDVIKTLESLPKTVENKQDLEMFIKDVFSDEGKEGIQLSTIHKAKGLEADNVFIICPSLIPSALAKLEWEKEEERHLQYVMCTRPKNSLNFVTENEIRANNVYAESKSFYKEMIRIKEEVYAKTKV